MLGWGPRPGVERSGTPGSLEYKGRAREVGDSRISRSQRLCYRTLRALGFLFFVILGFRFAPPQALRLHPLRGFWNI
jgi:hypothetical protein